MAEHFEQIQLAAQKDGQIEDIVDFIDHLIQHNKQNALYILKKLFFAPETHPRVRYTLAGRLGALAPYQVFQQLLSYFILHKFPDTLALIAALRSFDRPDILPALMDYYPQATYREQLEIIEALAQISAPETVEFLSQIFNEQIQYRQEVSSEHIYEIRQRASSALSKKIMRFD
jgi:hypothetical protein